MERAWRLAPQCCITAFKCKVMYAAEQRKFVTRLKKKQTYMADNDYIHVRAVTQMLQWKNTSYKLKQ